MWFMIRVAFCVGLVYSFTPATDVTSEASAVRTALVQASAAPLREVAEGAVAACARAPKLCLEGAQLLAGARSANPTASKSGSESERPIADTLTAADRATPWHGPKETRGQTRARAATRPET
ncbi:MAG: hypothetical protein JO137_04070 [Hyphomicrobiales bacterium]|nr:hypothetical protein [Hyphomicrobiales bacterium]MBV9430980.1 hypothetical protein [Hyphomicrobiales bacterium]